MKVLLLGEDSAPQSLRIEISSESDLFLHYIHVVDEDSFMVCPIVMPCLSGLTSCLGDSRTAEAYCRVCGLSKCLDKNAEPLYSRASKLHCNILFM